jgi:hypothetical protein
MNRRNWTDLSRKLVDRYDMIFLNDMIEAALGLQALSFFGKGVLPTKLYPTPYAVTLSGAVLGGTVSGGMAFDPTGQLLLGTGGNAFTMTPPGGSLRWDLLTVRFARTPDTLIAKPSNPLVTCYLNLLDAITIQVIPGTSGVAAYPACPGTDIILSGIKLPSGATFGTDCTLDLSVRDLASLARVPLQIGQMPASAAVDAGLDIVELTGGAVNATLVDPTLMGGRAQTFALVSGTAVLVGTIGGVVDITLDSPGDRITIYSNGTAWRQK